MLEAVLRTQFIKGPGASKVAAGEYALFLSYDTTQRLDPDSSLGPASSVTMAMAIGKYESEFKSVCPRPGCRSQDFTPHTAWGSVW